MKYIYWLLAIICVTTLVYLGIEKTERQHDPELVVGQNMIVGMYSSILDAANISYLEEVKPGAIVLYRYNIESLEETRILIQDLQKIALRTAGVPYFIMIDEEPGGATRLNIFRDAFGESGPDWQAIRRDIETVRDLGINVVLSPLVDLEFGTKGSVSHRMPIRTADELADFNDKFISLVAEYDIATTLKHFPGLGLVGEDTHMKILRSTASTTTLEKSLALFKRGVDAGVPFVMTNHAIYNSIDPTRSASVSKKVLELLRSTVGFEGLVITDDITNMPIGNPERMQPLDAAVEALKAGHNMVMFGSRRALTSVMHEGLVDIYKKDPEMKRIFDRNFYRVMKYKRETIYRGPFGS